MFCAARHDGLCVESHVQRGMHCSVWFCFICLLGCFLWLWVSGQGGRIHQSVSYLRCLISWQGCNSSLPSGTPLCLWEINQWSGNPVRSLSEVKLEPLTHQEGTKFHWLFLRSFSVRILVIWVFLKLCKGQYQTHCSVSCVNLIRSWLQKHFETTIGGEFWMRLTLESIHWVMQMVCPSVGKPYQEWSKCVGREGWEWGRCEDRDQPLLLPVHSDFVTKTCCREYLPTP